jgi:hypothetical protein
MTAIIVRRHLPNVAAYAAIGFVLAVILLF